MKIINQVLVMSLFTTIAACMIHHGSLLFPLGDVVAYYINGVYVGLVACMAYPLVNLAALAIDIQGRTKLIMPVCILYYIFMYFIVLLVVELINRYIGTLPDSEFITFIMIAGITSRHIERLYQYWK